MKTYDTVIFDLDGTLLDTLEDLADAVNAVMRAHGFPQRTLEEVRKFVGNGRESICYAFIGRRCRLGRIRIRSHKGICVDMQNFRIFKKISCRIA